MFCCKYLWQVHTWPCLTTCSISAMQRLQRRAAAAEASCGCAPPPSPPAAAAACSSWSVHLLQEGSNVLVDHTQVSVNVYLCALCQPLEHTPTPVTYTSLDATSLTYQEVM
jgi:hypothetical protein